MASRLPITGLHVQPCGGAHVRNLGAFASPDGHLVFDSNDFDETIPAPGEWDIIACYRKSIVSFAAAYADQVTSAYKLFIKAIEAGKIKTTKPA